MKLTLISSIAGLALLGAASAASATTPTVYNLTLTTIPNSSLSEAFAGGVFDGDTTDDFTFSIPSKDYVGTTFTLDLTGLQTGSDSLAIFKGTPGSGTQVGPTTVNGSSIDATLLPGSYYAQAVITAPAGEIGGFTAQVIASPVSAAPEPSTWVLMIAGVAMTGGMLRYRRNAAPSLTLA